MKRICALILSVVLSVCMVSCGQQSPTNSQIHQIIARKLVDNTITHEELTKALPNLKRLVKDSLGENEYFNWEEFEKISEIRQFKSPELVGDFAKATAFYAAGSEMIVVCPKFFDIETGDQKTYCLIHELTHSLVGVGRRGEGQSMRLFIEGITDYLANLVLVDTGLEYSLTYQNELYCIVWLSSLYGVDRIVKIVYDGDIIDFIDEQAGRSGAGNDLHEALATIDKSKDKTEVKNAILAEIEILSAMSNDKVSEHFTEVFEEQYAPYLN